MVCKSKIFSLDVSIFFMFNNKSAKYGTNETRGIQYTINVLSLFVKNNEINPTQAQKRTIYESLN